MRRLPLMLTHFPPLELQGAHQFPSPMLMTLPTSVCVGRGSGFVLKQNSISASEMESRNLVRTPTNNNRNAQQGKVLVTAAHDARYGQPTQQGGGGIQSRSSETIKDSWTSLRIRTYHYVTPPAAR